MSNNSIENIAEQMATIAKTVTGIKAAAAYGVKEIDQYEAIDVYWDGADIEEESLKSYLAHYTFILTIYIYATNIKDIQIKQRTHAWNFLKKIQDYPDLNGTIDKFTITAVRNGIIETNNRGYAFSEFTIIADKEEYRT